MARRGRRLVSWLHVLAAAASLWSVGCLDTQVFEHVECTDCGCAGDECLDGRCIPRTPVAQIAAGYAYSCALLGSGEIWCWGDNAQGQLGRGDTAPHDAPAAAGTGRWRTVAAGYEHACAIDTGSQLLCWGRNFEGQLGLGAMAPLNVLTPTAVPGLLFTDVDTGFVHTCAIDRSGVLSCWGRDSHGQLGTQTTEDIVPVPEPVASSQLWVKVSTSEGSSCAIDTNTDAWCWGNNSDGQLGLGTQTLEENAPQPLAGPSWAQITAGYTHTCGSRGGQLWCWGGNASGQVGTGARETEPSPTLIRDEAFLSISAGKRTLSTCGVDATGRLWCWGDNASGQLGVLGDDQVAPTLVDDRADWRAVSVGGMHACALRDGGTVFCWGSNDSGQLDLPGVASAPPTRVCL